MRTLTWRDIVEVTKMKDVWEVTGTKLSKFIELKLHVSEPKMQDLGFALLDFLPWSNHPFLFIHSSLLEWEGVF